VRPRDWNTKLRTIHAATCSGNAASPTNGTNAMSPNAAVASSEAAIPSASSDSVLAKTMLSSTGRA